MPSAALRTRAYHRSSALFAAENLHRAYADCRRPKEREVFAANFRDRIVHHLWVREVGAYWEKRFIPQSYAGRPGKGVHRAVSCLQKYLREATFGGRRRAYFLKLDIENFFNSLHKPSLKRLVMDGLRKQYHIPRRRLPFGCAQLGRPSIAGSLLAISPRSFSSISISTSSTNTSNTPLRCATTSAMWMILCF